MILEAAAWVALATGVVLGVLIMTSSDFEPLMSVLIGIGVIFGGLTQWAIFQGASLVFDYLSAITSNTFVVATASGKGSSTESRRP